ncbi:MAG: hypothetical protein E7184_01185 [Erysipelotrichaceae bacterium]|nr:hypothetical protein [Erysipelotrichaceae bacterium]
MMAKYNDYLLAYEAVEKKVESAIQSQTCDAELLEALNKILKGLKENFDTIYADEEIIHETLVEKIKKQIAALENYKSVENVKR